MSFVIESLVKELASHIKDHGSRNHSPIRVTINYNVDINGFGYWTVAYPLKPRGIKQITWHSLTNYMNTSLTLEDLLAQARTNQKHNS